MAKIKVLIADDHLVVREGLMLMLQSSDEFEVVGEASNGKVALALAEELQPDVVLIDIQMPEIEGIEVTQQITRRWPDTNVVILTSFDQEEYILRGIQAGAKGYVLKDTGLDELLNVVRAAAKGESLLPANVATTLVGRLAGKPKTQPLTDREHDVLRLLIRGMRNKEIAAELHITERTVKNHVANIIAKLGAKSRTEAATLALKYNLVTMD